MDGSRESYRLGRRPSGADQWLAVAEPMGHASEKLRTPEAYWLFKRVADSVKRLCILELANGDYWIIDSPTGTYMSGHADRWHWPCRSGVLGPGLRSRVRSEVTRTHL